MSHDLASSRIVEQTILSCEAIAILRVDDAGSLSKDEAAAVLELELEQQRTERRIERFFWMFAVIGLVDVILLSYIPVFAGSICSILSLVLLIGLARWLEVPWVVANLERFLNKLMAEKKSTRKKEAPPPSKKKKLNK